MPEKKAENSLSKGFSDQLQAMGQPKS